MTDDRETAAKLAEAWLAEAYELVASGWSRNAPARTADGEPVEPDSPDAAAWSITGALVRVWRTTKVDDDVLALSALGRANLALTTATKQVPRVWNDAPLRRKPDVLEAILTAVSLVRVVPADSVDLAPRPVRGRVLRSAA